MVTPRWSLLAVACAHFAPPTQRTRRDGLDHRRSVLLPVAPGGNDYLTSSSKRLESSSGWRESNPRDSYHGGCCEDSPELPPKPV